MKAQEARKIAASVSLQTVKDQLDDVRAGIRKACNDGKFYYNHLNSLLTGAIKALTEDGFKVVERTDTERGSIYTWYEISW